MARYFQEQPRRSNPSGRTNAMRYLATLFFAGATLLGLIAGLQPSATGPDPDAPAVTFARSADQVEAYDFVEITVSVPKPTAKNPFTDVTITAVFTREGDKPVAVQGFYDSANGSTYRIRFMPSKPGRHSYEVTFRQGDVAQTH
jgi:hypothetical protein